MTDPSLIAVRTDVVLDALVGSMHVAATERAGGDGLEWLESVGYHARAVELERFTPARASLPPLTEAPADLAAREPLERPEPGESPSWLIPGPGGHVRHYLALRALEDVPRIDPLAGKRAWMTGFFRHCAEEAGGPTSSSSSS
jgi:hypothetical protein